jgi:hypothetical protein
VNLWLLSAGWLTVLIGVVHSILGEARIFRPLRKGGWVPTQGAPLLREFQVRILWGSWHLVTVFGWGVAALLIRMAQPDTAAALRADLAGISGAAMVVAALLVAGATRGKHPAWVALLLASGLAAAGMGQ